MMTRDLWLAALADVAPIPEQHPDAITINEFAAMVGVRHTAAKDRMRALVKAGKARRVAKQCNDITGRSQMIPAYVLIQETPDDRRASDRMERRAGRVRHDPPSRSRN